MTKEQKSAEQLAQEIVEEYGPLIENPALEFQLETVIIQALKDREAITWPSDEHFKSHLDEILPYTEIGDDLRIDIGQNAYLQALRGEFKAGVEWLKSRIGGKRE